MKRTLLMAVTAILVLGGMALAADMEGPPDVINVDGAVYYSDGSQAAKCTPFTVELHGPDGKLKYTESLCTGQDMPPVKKFQNLYKLALAGRRGEDIVVIRALGVTNSTVAKDFTLIDITGPRPGIISDIGSAINALLGTIFPRQVPAEGEMAPEGTEPSPVPAVPNDVAGMAFVTAVAAIVAVSAFLMLRGKKKGREMRGSSWAGSPSSRSLR